MHFDAQLLRRKKKNSQSLQKIRYRMDFELGLFGQLSLSDVREISKLNSLSVFAVGETTLRTSSRHQPQRIFFLKIFWHYVYKRPIYPTQSILYILYKSQGLALHSNTCYCISKINVLKLRVLGTTKCVTVQIFTVWTARLHTPVGGSLTQAGQRPFLPSVSH